MDSHMIEKPTIIVSVDGLCNNFIEGKPVLTIEEVEEIVGREIDPFHDYYEIYNMGGTISKEQLSDDIIGIRITENGVMDEYGEAILMKDAVKHVIDTLQEYYDRYDELYSQYVEDYRNRVIEFVKNRFCYNKKSVTYSEHTENEQGYIYVMLHQGYYKIGKSVDCMRLGEYTKLAEEPEYVYVVRVNHMNRMERKLHRMFADKRCRDGKCEWFTLDESDLSTIRNMLKEDEVEDPNHTVGYRRYVLKEDV